MKKQGILNPQLAAACAAIGHTEYLVIADPGLPLPKGVEVIDLSLVTNQPKLTPVLKAVLDEFVCESAIVAEEMEAASTVLHSEVGEALGGIPAKTVPHEEFKRLCSEAKAIVRTGETTSYANVILVGGVNF